MPHSVLKWIVKKQGGKDWARFIGLGQGPEELYDLVNKAADYRQNGWPGSNTQQGNLSFCHFIWTGF